MEELLKTKLCILPLSLTLLIRQDDPNLMQAQKVSLKNRGKVSTISFKPKVGGDITKIIFAQFKRLVKENNK
jgi:hypothetical protein